MILPGQAGKGSGASLADVGIHAEPGKSRGLHVLLDAEVNFYMLGVTLVTLKSPIERGTSVVTL